MKTVNALKKILAVLLIVIISACSKDESGENVPGGNNNGNIETRDGVTADEIETDEGEIGISISARGIAKKGYKPSTAEISITATSSDIPKDNTVSIDPFTNIAYLSFKNKDLSEEAQEELKGVDISIVIKDGDGNELASTSISQIIFKSSPDEQEIDNESLEDQFAQLNLRNDIAYYLQIVKEGSADIHGAPTSWHYQDNTIDRPMVIYTLNQLDYSADPPNGPGAAQYYSTFFFEEVEGEPGVYTVSVHDGDAIYYWYLNSENRLNVQSVENRRRNGGNTPDTANRGNYKFKIEKVGLGQYIFISLKTGHPIAQTGNSLPNANANTGDNNPLHFRIMAFDIDWDIQTVDYKHLQPILPPAGTAFAYNSTLVNCSSGQLSQEVGVEDSRTSTSIFGWEESMSVSTSQEYSMSVSMESEISAEFYGVGTSISSSVSETYTASESKTRTSTTSGAFETSETITLSTKRSIIVPSKKATLIADIYQTYENIKIPFVQSFRIKGNYQEDGQALSGEEITTQFVFNQFTGVITEVGNDYIEVTIRGTNTIDRLIDTKTIADDVPSNCGG
ncbi:hypothetical protein [Flagellimonas myxillae]|uniref:hypothetical protein n=1 Tax=Flagellimonas myxillae TaxID=2942214 RepID=UPI00201F69D7|nr:hypothetical protein [Muricauda myxillae]MCL6266485.1 hypothetical protein [Muricauda myxillae]